MKKENGKTLNHKLNSGEWIEGEKNHEKRIAIKMTFYRSYAIKVFSFQSICVMLVMATYASYAIILKWISNFLLLVAKTPNIYAYAIYMKQICSFTSPETLWHNDACGNVDGCHKERKKKSLMKPIIWKSIYISPGCRWIHANRIKTACNRCELCMKRIFRSKSF